MQKYPDHLSRGSFNASIAAKWVTWHPIVRRQHQRVVIAPSRITHSQLVKYRGNSGNASTAKGTMMRWTDLVESGKKKRNKSKKGIQIDNEMADTSNRPHNQLKIVTVNINFLSRGSQLLLTKYILDEKIDVCCITETKKTVTDSWFITGYQLFEVKRSNSTSGGCLVVAKTDLTPTAITTCQDPDIDLLWISIKLGNESIMLAGAYIQPQCEIKIRKFCHLIERGKQLASDSGINHFGIIGDFNARHTNWQDHSTNTHGLIVNECTG